MATHHLEVERKYELADLTSPAVEIDWNQLENLTVVETVQEHLEATYFDTPCNQLGKNMIALRRRLGGYDQGWHIKFDDRAGARHEMHFDLLADEAKMPAAVNRFLQSAVGFEELGEKVSLITDRTRTVLADSSGVRVAEICRDSVAARDFSTDIERTWNEWEVELLEAGEVTGEEIFEDCEKIFSANGIVPSQSSAKIARALGLDAEFEARRTGADKKYAVSRVGAGEKKKKSKERASQRRQQTAAASSIDLLNTALDALLSDLLSWELKFRAGVPESVHGLRQTIRKVESLLRFAARPFPRTEQAAQQMDAALEGLRGIYRSLAPARDVDIVRAFLAEVGTEPGVVTATDRQELEEMLADDAEKNSREVLKVLDSDGFAMMRSDVAALQENLAHEVELPLNCENFVNKVAKRIRKSLVAFNKDELKQLWKSDPTEFAYDVLNNDPLFRVRRAAQIGRYCMEALTATGIELTDDQQQLAHLCTDLHRELSALSDEQVTLTWLQSAARRAVRRGQDRLAIGYLMGRSSYYAVGLRLTDHSYVPSQLKALKKLDLK